MNTSQQEIDLGSLKKVWNVILGRAEIKGKLTWDDKTSLHEATRPLVIGRKSAGTKSDDTATSPTLG